MKNIDMTAVAAPIGQLADFPNKEATILPIMSPCGPPTKAGVT